MGAVVNQLSIYDLAGGVEETNPADQSGNGGAMPSPRSIDAEWWDTHEQIHLFEPPPVTTPLFEIDPEQIEVRRVHQSLLVDLQRSMSRVVWRTAPGRRIPFTVNHGNHLLGIGYLASPILRLSARDQFLELPSDTATKVPYLNCLADLSVCVGAQPVAWHWNIGKLIAQLATTLGGWWEEDYGDPLIGITTTSVWGRGSQYNRLWKMIGYTQGYGNCHIPDHVYHRMVGWLRRNGVTPYSSSSARMFNLRKFGELTGGNTLGGAGHLHGQKRGIYYAPTVDPSTRPDVIMGWYQRWGYPRYLRTRDVEPPYKSGLTEASA